MRSKPRASENGSHRDLPGSVTQAGAPRVPPDWRFQNFGSKQLAPVAKLLSCRVEDLMDMYEGTPIGGAYAGNLAKRLQYLYQWSPAQID